MKFLTSILFLFIANTVHGQMRNTEHQHPRTKTQQHNTTKSINSRKHENNSRDSIPNYVPAHRAFVSPSVSWTPGYKPSYSVEAGTWGISSYTSFGAIVDAVIVDRRVQYVLGAKAYYTAWQNDKLSYMFYVAPKINTSNGHTLLEYGANQNYTLSKDFLFEVTLGNQLDEDGYTTTFLSLGIIYLIPKK